MAIGVAVVATAVVEITVVADVASSVATTAVVLVAMNAAAATAVAASTFVGLQSRIGHHACCYRQLIRGSRVECPRNINWLQTMCYCALL